MLLKMALTNKRQDEKIKITQKYAMAYDLAVDLNLFLLVIIKIMSNLLH